jgi:MoxR-like ATPase
VSEFSSLRMNLLSRQFNDLRERYEDMTAEAMLRADQYLRERNEIARQMADVRDDKDHAVQEAKESHERMIEALNRCDGLVLLLCRVLEESPGLVCEEKTAELLRLFKEDYGV